jgi:hypothetical protein
MEKENTTTNKLMSWIENGPKKKLGRFFVRQQLPAKTEMCPFHSISLIYVRGSGKILWPNIQVDT